MKLVDLIGKTVADISPDDTCINLVNITFSDGSKAAIDDCDLRDPLGQHFEDIPSLQL